MISILITNYNTWDLCLRSVNAIKPEDLKYISEIIIIDDASDSDAPIELIKHPLVQIEKNQTNMGYAASVNKAFKLAKEQICVLLDSDAYIISGIYSILEQFKNNPRLGILALKLVDENGNMTGRAEPEVQVWGLILGQQLDAKIGKYLYRPSEKWSIFSCGMAVSKLAFEEVNGFDTSFDFLDADHDFSMKINRSDWKIDFENRCLVYHIGNGSPQSTSKRVLRFYENRFKLLLKYNKIQYPKLLTALIYIRISLEFAILNILYLFSNKKSNVVDKLIGRKNILRFFKKNG